MRQVSVALRGKESMKYFYTWKNFNYFLLAIIKAKNESKFNLNEEKTKNPK